jgi:hypothetical protein
MVGVAGGVGCGVGLTTTTRGKTASAKGGVEGRQTVGSDTGGSVTTGCGRAFDRKSFGTGETLPLGSISTMNLPMGGNVSRRPKEMLKRKLMHDDGMGNCSSDNDG